MHLSFRYKIQFAVLAILLVCLGSYVVLASRTLEQEKKAGLLDSTRSASELLSSRYRSYLAEKYYWLQASLSNNEASPKALSELGELVAVYEVKPKSISQIYGPERATNISKGESCSGKVFSIEGADSFAVCVNVGKRTFVAFLNSSVLVHLNKDSIDASVSIVDGRSQKDLLISGLSISNFDSSTINQLSKYPKLTEIKTLKVANDDYVFALAPIENTNLYVILGYPQEIALVAVRQLQIRSLYFALLIFGLTGLLAFWIGGTLSKRLVDLASATEKVSKGNLDLPAPKEEQDEIGELAHSIYSMSLDLKKYVAEVSEKSRMETELKTAQAVQNSILPTNGFSGKPWSVEGFYKSASECGGDFWHYWTVDDHLFFVIADATGHGAPAALVTSAARSALAVSELLKESDILKTVEYLDHSIRSISKGGILMTAIVGKVNLKNGSVEFVNCSHEPGLLVRAGQAGIDLICDPTSPRLGDTLGPQKFTKGHFSLDPGDNFFVYTDGLSEAADPDGNIWGEKRFFSAIVECLRKGEIASQKNELIYERYLAQTSGVNPPDDVTMMLVSRAQDS